MKPHWYVWWDVEWRNTSLEGQGCIRPHWYIWWYVKWRDTSLCGTGLAEATLVCLVRCGMKRHITLRDTARWGHTYMSGEMCNEETHHSEGQGWMRPHWYKSLCDVKWPLLNLGKNDLIMSSDFHCFNASLLNTKLLSGKHIDYMPLNRMN